MNVSTPASTNNYPLDLGVCKMVMGPQDDVYREVVQTDLESRLRAIWE